MDPGALDRAGKYHLGECQEILLSLPVSLCLKKSYAKLAPIFHRQTYGYQVANKRLFSCRGGPMCPPLTEGAHTGAPLQFRDF